jgi:hypothetical protein
MSDDWNMEPKSRWNSTTIRALIVALITVLAGVGIDVGINDEMTQRIAEAAETVILIISLIVAWAGREKASQPIQKKEPVEEPEDDPTFPPKMLGLGIAFLLILSVAGCAGVSPGERSFHYGVEGIWNNNVKEEYTDYVNNDPLLGPEEKADRVGPQDSSVSEMDLLLMNHRKNMEARGVR